MLTNGAHWWCSLTVLTDGGHRWCSLVVLTDGARVPQGAAAGGVRPHPECGYRDDGSRGGVLAARAAPNGAGRGVSSMRGIDMHEVFCFYAFGTYFRGKNEIMERGA